MTRRRRRLSDLYVQGREVSVDDGTGDPVTVWLHKLNEPDRDAIIRRSSAAKARYQVEYQSEESELFVATCGQISEFLGREDMLNLVITDDLFKANQRIEEQLRHDENTWGKDDLIQGLLDAWTGDDTTPGLAAAYAEDENDPAALKVKAELDRFEDDVKRLVEEERQRLLRELEDPLDQELARLATREVLKRRADEVFMKEWNRQQIFFSVRDPDDRHKRYFETLAEVDDLDDKIRQFLEQQNAALFVSNTEGKDSPPSAASSSSSEATSVVEASASSGPEAVSA
jgi:hypothetical protein